MISRTLKAAVREGSESIYELAQKTGIDENVLHEFLAEEEPVLDLETAENLARHFDMRLQWCFRIEDGTLIPDFSVPVLGEDDETKDDSGPYAIGLEPTLANSLRSYLDSAIRGPADVDEIAVAIGASQAILDALFAENGEGVPIFVADRLATLLGLRLVWRAN